MTPDANENTIFYRFSFDDGSVAEHAIPLTPGTPAHTSADWLRIGFQQCPHCPLQPDEAPDCPFAVALEKPVRFLSNLTSYSELDVEVNFRGRKIQQHTTLQRAAGSLLGAIGATCGCPHTRFLKAMAWFHLPFSSSDETLYRVLGTYLLGQHLRVKHGLDADWTLDGLRDAYHNLRKVNLGMAKRLRTAAEEDSSLNGLVLLDLLAADTLNCLEQYDGELDRYFDSFLK